MLFPRVPTIRRRRPPIYDHCRNPFSGQGNIPRKLTINGITVDSATDGCLYLPSDTNVGTGAWAENNGQAAGAMSLQAGSPTYDVPSLFGAGGGVDEGVAGDGTAFWKTASVFANPTTKDIVAWIAFRWNDGSLIKTICGNWVTGASGFMVYTDGTYHLIARITDGATIRNVATDVLVDNCDYDAWFFGNRDGYGQWYVNGAASGQAVNISAAVNADADNEWAIMAKPDGAIPFEGTVYGVGLWLCDGWLDTHLQATLAAELTQRRCGLRPQLAPPAAYPLSVTRSTTDHVSRVSQGRIHLVGAGALPLDEPVAGEAWIRVQAAETNRCVKPFNMDTYPPWTLRGTPSVTINTNEVVDPRGNNQAALIENLQGVGVADVYQLCSGLGADARISQAHWLRRKSTSGVVRVGLGGAAFDVDLSTLPDEFVRIKEGSPHVTLTGTPTATGAGQAYWDIYAQSGGPLDVYVFNPQVSNLVPCGSDIIADPSATTRNASVVTLSSTVAALLAATREGTIECEIMVGKLPGAVAACWCLHDGTVNNLVEGVITSTNKMGCYVRTAAGWQAFTECASAITAWTPIPFSCAWRRNHISVVCRGEWSIDTTAEIPTAPTVLTIWGTAAGTSTVGEQWIRRLRVYPYARH